MNSLTFENNLYTSRYVFLLGEWQEELIESLDQLTKLLCGDEHLSAYELQSSGLAPALLQVLSPQANGMYVKCDECISASRLS